tara:strand:- start:49 stop:531 length:483 start_codon:yes stop_codon:yes gene_type:complete
MEYYELPQPEEISKKEREDAMGAYLMMFASIGAGLPFPIINLIAAVIYYFVNRKKGRFVKFHSYQSLISQLPTTLLNAITLSWVIRNLINQVDFDQAFFGFLTAVIVTNIAYFVFSIIGAVKAKKGQMYYLFFFGRLSYIKAYKIKEDDDRVFENKPPVL